VAKTFQGVWVEFSLSSYDTSLINSGNRPEMFVSSLADFNLGKFGNFAKSLSLSLQCGMGR
jgi:hypothetical protein